MSTKSVHIHWFGNDLRINDQPFIESLSSAQGHFGVYFIDPRSIAQLTWGFRKMGIHRLEWLRAHLAELQIAYRKRGSDLLIAFGKPEELLPQLVKKYDATLSFQREYATEERTIQKRVLHELQQDNVFTYDGNFLVQPDSLSFHEFPRSFSGFRKKVEKRISISSFDAPPVLSFPPSPETFKTIDFKQSLHHAKTVFPFSGGELAAHARLHEYLDETRNIDAYKRTRNGLLGADYSSKLSPWLSTGAMSVSQIYAEIKQYEQAHGTNEGTDWFVFELLWRDYFRHAGKCYQDDLFRGAGITDSTYPGKKDVDLFKKWAFGNIGNAFVDANMRELYYTGFMSNRGRQNVASYLVHDLGVDWRWGAAWFEHHLIDYDVYSNQGNWLYISGLGFNPKGKSVFDTNFQAQHYDPDGAYCEQWKNERIN